MMNAKYTVVLKSILEDEQAKQKLFDALSKYPLYEKKSNEEFIPSYIPTRDQLNNKIINAYKYREIGFETVGRFLDELEIAMDEIMPEYNLLFFSADQDFNIIYNVDYQRTTNTQRTGENESKQTGLDNSTGEATNDSTTTARVEHSGKSVHSETPQNQLNISNKNIDSVDYADDATWNKDTNDDTATNTGSSTSKTQNTSSIDASGSHNENEQMLETTKGNFGVVSAQDLVLKYRETILNIEQMIINDERLQELFMIVY